MSDMDKRIEAAYNDGFKDGMTFLSRYARRKVKDFIKPKIVKTPEELADLIDATLSRYNLPYTKSNE